MAGKVEAEDEEFLGTAPSNKKDTMSEDLEMHKMTDRDILGGEGAKEGMTKDHKSVRQKKSETQFSAISTRLKVLLAFGALALFLNFGLTGACFYLVRQLKIEIANSRDQAEMGGTSSNQTSNNGVERTTEPQLIEGPPGMKGDPGAPGPKGKKGSVGLHGVPGLNGLKGKQGLKGEKGNPGSYGQKGVKGELGLQGIKGEMGEKGLAGLPGRDGRDGRNGTYGSKGLMGDKGQKGGIGPTGSRGVNGQKGEPGRSWKGAKGEPGTSHQGPIGPKGNKGEVGIEGLKGDIGNVGNTGEKGDKGQKGDSDVATLQQRIQELQRVRLVDGGSYYGRVEVFHNGVWGTVCDDGWDTNDAAVFCRMMGFKGANLAPASANYGQGSDQIWLDDVNCDGSEIDLDSCSKSSWGNHNCGHGEDAGASCIR